MEIVNRKAKFEYFIEETYEAGIELKGTEIKSIRKSAVDLRDSYVLIRKNEVYLLNAFIGKYEEGNIFNHDERRTRKLLLHKNEMSLDGTTEPSEIVSEGQEMDVVITSIEKAERKISFSIKSF